MLVRHQEHNPKGRLGGETKKSTYLSVKRHHAAAYASQFWVWEPCQSTELGELNPLSHHRQNSTWQCQEVQCGLNGWWVSKVLTLKPLVLATHANRASHNAILYADFIYSDISMLKEQRSIQTENESLLSNNKSCLPPVFLDFSLYTRFENFRFSYAISLGLTMTVQLLEQSTCVHAMESEALPENLDIAGECWNCTWGAQRKSWSQSQHSTVYWQDCHPVGKIST